MMGRAGMPTAWASTAVNSLLSLILLLPAPRGTDRAGTTRPEVQRLPRQPLGDQQTRGRGQANARSFVAGCDVEPLRSRQRSDQRQVVQSEEAEAGVGTDAPEPSQALVQSASISREKTPGSTPDKAANAHAHIPAPWNSSSVSHEVGEKQREDRHISDQEKNRNHSEDERYGGYADSVKRLTRKRTCHK